jgi:hypothetical protein
MTYYDLKFNVADIPWRSLTKDEIDSILETRIRAFKARPSPKREGYVIERIAEMNNLWSADAEAQSRGKEKRNRHITRHNSNQEAELRELQMMILTLDFPKNDYHISKRRSDAGKIRDLVIQRYFPWRILPHAIMQVIGEKLYKRLIYDSCACIKGKGLHFGAKRMKMFLRRYDMNYVWKADYKKFYQSIPHELVINELRKMYKDERFLEMMSLILSTYESDVEDLLDEENEKRRANRGI